MNVPKKQLSSQEQWEEAARVAHLHVSRERVDELADETRKRIERYANGKVAFGWSGGKDSIVLEHVVAPLGITNCCLVVCNLEYPAFTAWVDQHRPPDLSVVNTGQDLPWLARNPHMLFSTSSAESSRWFSIMNWRGQQAYYDAHGITFYMVGRRIADGNFVGSKKTDPPYLTKKKGGMTTYSPLAEWSHMEMLAYINHHQLALPPNYGWPRGYRTGTGPWAKRRATTHRQAWDEINVIDRSIIVQAAEYLDEARQYMEETRGQFQ